MSFAPSLRIFHRCLPPSYLSLDFLVVPGGTFFGLVARVSAESWALLPSSAFLSNGLGDFVLVFGCVPVLLGALPLSPPCPILFLLLLKFALYLIKFLMINFCGISHRFCLNTDDKPYKHKTNKIVP
jgi:hypothetical protein